MTSYSSESHGLAGFLRETAGLYRLHSNDVGETVRSQINDIRQVESRINERVGLELRDRDVLEIGPGQFLSQMTYLACSNRVVGIDRDVIARGFGPFAYINMLRRNGVRRTVKTVGRKLMGVDREYESQLVSQLGLKRLPRLTVYQMDVCKMTFPARSFDFVYSRSVLHSLPNPAAAIDEIVRVLRPGGVAYVSIHPYTSETGCLDPRIYTARRNEIPAWAHLRPHLRGTIYEPNVYLNKLRLPDWRGLFASKMIGLECILAPSGKASAEAAKSLQSQGELTEYSLEELLTGQFVALWQKPSD
jgi:SAM-dependent methyltransferase